MLDFIHTHGMFFSGAILLIAYIFIASEKIQKSVVALVGAALTMLLGLIPLSLHLEDNVKGVFEYVDFEVIFLLIGMMIIVNIASRSGVFKWMALHLLKATKGHPKTVLFALAAFTAIASAFLDNVTTVVLIMPVTFVIAKEFDTDPVPFLITEVLASNIGGTATLIGDPPNIIIGTSLGYSFSDFITNTGVMALISLVFVVIYFYVAFRKEILAGAPEHIDTSAMPTPRETITNKRDFAISSIIFACAVVMLVTHAQTGLTVAFIGTVIAIITLITSGKYALEIIKKVDYKTLLFFIGLFIVVGGLEPTGILEIIAGFIGDVSKGNLKVMVAIIIWVSAIASAFVDNIPFAATMVPVIQSLAAAQGVDLSTLAWALSMGTDIGGSATPIGASANVVGTSVAAKNGHVIGWGKYCITAIPATVVVIAVSMVFIFVRYC